MVLEQKPETGERVELIDISVFLLTICIMFVTLFLPPNFPKNCLNP